MNLSLTSKRIEFLIEIEVVKVQSTEDKVEGEDRGDGDQPGAEDQH